MSTWIVTKEQCEARRARLRIVFRILNGVVSRKAIRQGAFRVPQPGEWRRPFTVHGDRYGKACRLARSDGGDG